MPVWNPNLRSKTVIRTTDTRYYVDPSIATVALGIGPKDLLNDLNTLGLLFETMCVRDLRVYAGYLDGEVLHYKDKSGLECDTVIHLRNGKYGLAEIKLGGQKAIEKGVTNLKTLADKLDTRLRPPARAGSAPGGRSPGRADPGRAGGDDAVSPADAGRSTG